MRPTFLYDFNDIPLLISSDKYECAGVVGKAEIAYSREGDWSIKSISLDGFKRNKGMSGRPWLERQVTLEEHTPLYKMIFDRLDSTEASNVQDAVNEHLIADRESEADARADKRHELQVSA